LAVVEMDPPIVLEVVGADAAADAVLPGRTPDGPAAEEATGVAAAGAAGAAGVSLTQNRHHFLGPFLNR